MRRFSEKHTEDYRHAKCVTRIALCLYDDLREEHGLGKQERYMVYVAAMLHDIGWGMSGGQHNKCGMRYILEDRKLPLSPHQRVIVALVVRYHRGGLPKRCHPLYGELRKKDRYVVRILSGILRTADGLDSSHCGVVRGVRAKVSGDTLYLLCSGMKSGDAEKKAAAKKANLLIRMLSSGLEIRWVTR